MFGLLCTADGCPIAVEVFEGSTGDPKTVAAQVDKIRHRFGLQRVVLVGDRGMLTGARIREDLKDVDGLRWITTLRAPTIRKLIKAGEVAQTMFDERDLAEISSPEFRGERLIVCRNPILADQRQRKRQELLAATEKELMPIVKATGRAKEPLRGAAAIGDDHDRAAGERQRSSVVQPAQRSPAAHRKASGKRTDDDLPVHSFRSLMSDLGTLTVNEMQLAAGGDTFSLPTQPTPVQRRCFELLEVSPRM